MQKLFGVLLLFLVMLACKTEQAAEQQQQTMVETLFLSGADDWEMGGNAEWKVDETAIIGRLDSGSGYLMTKTSYGDFELTLEFNPDSTINSGVFGRCQHREISPETCYEFNIWDLHPNQDYRTGALVTKAKALAYIETIDQWNTYRIRCVGNHLEAWINGEKMVDYEDGGLSEGFIAIQASGTGTMKFRKVELTAL